MLQNLWKVTNEFLASYGQEWADVLQVQSIDSGACYKLGEIAEKMKATLFDSTAPGDEIATDLLLVGDHWAARWSSGWVWMYVPKLVDENDVKACPEILSTREIKCDETGVRSPVYGMTVAELNTKPGE